MGWVGCLFVVMAKLSFVMKHEEQLESTTYYEVLHYDWLLYRAEPTAPV